MIDATARRRLGDLQCEFDAHGAFEQQWPEDQFRVYPSNPPDLRVHVRGGLLIGDQPYWLNIGYNLVQPTRTCDFTDTTETQLSLNFSSAGYYRAYLMCYDGNYVFGYTAANAFMFLAGQEEHANAVEAEGELDALLNGGGEIIKEYPEPTGATIMPLCGLILRNNGTTGSDAAILPIDAVNRGRSYIWRDLRPRNWIAR